MYITIIPSSHSISTTPLTYHVGDIFRSQLKIGSLVEIPVGNNIEYGIVADMPVDAPLGKEIKSIVQVICSTPLLERYQIHMIHRIARHYMLPIHRVLGFFLPRPILRRLEKSNFSDLKDTFEKQKSEQESCISFFQNTVITPEVLRPYLSSWTMVICPDDIALSRFEKAFWEEGFFFLPNAATDARKSKAWRDIRNKKYPIVFSTRKTLFFNMREYTQILYLEDAFMNEYFHYPTSIHYNDILLFINESWDININIMTSIPLLKTLSMFRHFPINNIT